MVLFILSEIMFFVSIFWSFFHFKMSPSVFIGCVFPPIGINIIKMDCFPLLNTVFLVYSGIFLMNSLNYLKKGNFKFSFLNLIFTIILGLFFVAVQFFEYSESSFSFNDSCYGSVFFLLTGFHGFHVVVGLVFLIICAFRLYFTAKFNVFKKNKKLSYYNILVTNYCIYSKFNFYLVQKNLMKNISKDSSLISSISKKLSMDYFLTKTNSNFK